jgi:uncharacterized membrane protein YagU involved in acid resistance
MKSLIADGIDDVRKKGVRLAIAAIVATVVLELMMTVGAPNIMGIPPMNPADLVTNILGLPQGHALGTLAHFGLALIAFPLGYILIAYRRFPGIYLLRGALWGVLLWLGAMVVIVPLAGLPIFFGFGKPMVAALVAHIVYGVILAAIVGSPE